MKDRKEYYRKYNSKCEFINIRFNLTNDDDYELYKMIFDFARKWRMGKSEVVKFLCDGYKKWLKE